MMPTDSEHQSVKGTTGGSELGSVPLITYLDAISAANQAHRMAIVREWETWRTEHEHERDTWRLAHERVHEVEHRAIETSDARNNERLESMNEFRRQIETMLATYVTRDLLDSMIHTAEVAVTRVDRENQRRFDELNASVVEMNRQWANAQGRFTAYGVALSFFIIVLNLTVGIALALLT